MPNTKLSSRNNDVDVLSGVILAGGLSRRMGADKAYLEIDGVTLLDRVRRILTDSGANKTVVLGKPDEPDGLADDTPHSGPAIAIKNYLAKQPSGSRHIVCAVDMPFLTAELIEKLAKSGSWAQFENHTMPFLAIAGEEKRYDGDRLQGFLKAQQMIQLSAPENADILFRNLNHPEDMSEK